MVRNKSFCNAFWSKLVLTVLFTLCTIVTFAQPTGPGDPGQGDCGTSAQGPDEPCPLDTWVIILAVIALVFTAVHLYKKQNNALKANIL